MKIIFRKSFWFTINIDDVIKDIAINNSDVSGIDIFKNKYTLQYVICEILNKVAPDLTDEDDLLDAIAEIKATLIDSKQKVIKLWNNAQDS